jgi:hypothetical protein
MIGSESCEEVFISKKNLSDKKTDGADFDKTKD